MCKLCEANELEYIQKEARQTLAEELFEEQIELEPLEEIYFEQYPYLEEL